MLFYPIDVSMDNAAIPSDHIWYYTCMPIFLLNRWIVIGCNYKYHAVCFSRNSITLKANIAKYLHTLFQQYFFHILQLWIQILFITTYLPNFKVITLYMPVWWTSTNILSMNDKLTLSPRMSPKGDHLADRGCPLLATSLITIFSWKIN